MRPAPMSSWQGNQPTLHPLFPLPSLGHRQWVTKGCIRTGGRSPLTKAAGPAAQLPPKANSSRAQPPSRENQSGRAKEGGEQSSENSRGKDE